MKKFCFVPTCLNNSENAPNKVFIHVPRDTTTRNHWFETVGRKVVKTTKYCCEDHFNLREDSKDFSFYKRTGKTPRIKRGIVPHLFLNTCNSNIFYTQLGDAREEKSSEDEEDAEICIPRLKQVPVDIRAPEVKTELDERNGLFGQNLLFFENQKEMRSQEFLYGSSASSNDSACSTSLLNDTNPGLENFENSELADKKNILETEGCLNYDENTKVKLEEPDISQSAPAPEVKIENGVNNVSIVQLPMLSFVSCANTLGTLVKIEPGLQQAQPMPDQASENCEVQDVKRDACSYFGEYVAAELRSLPSEERFQIQQEIQDCLSAAVVRHISKLGASESYQDHNLPS